MGGQDFGVKTSYSIRASIRIQVIKFTTSGATWCGSTPRDYLEPVMDPEVLLRRLADAALKPGIDSERIRLGIIAREILEYRSQGESVAAVAGKT